MTTTIKVKFRPSTVAGRPGSIVYLVTHRRVVRQITTGYCNCFNTEQCHTYKINPINQAEGALGFGTFEQNHIEF